MQVYVELALIENFCIDFTLLYCAKLVSKNRASVWRVAFAAAFGACFAVLFPLFRLKRALAIAIKLISGAIICAFAGKYAKVKAYLKMTAIFLSFTFVLGGALIAVFSLSGTSFDKGGGYLLSSVPIGVPMFCALMLIIAARKIANKLRKAGRITVSLRIFSGGKSVELSGFFDSGNKVYYSGQPVSVIPITAALELVDESRINNTVKIHTVAGSKKLKIFTADKIEIYEGEKTDTVKNAIIGISPNPTGDAVLHPDLLEDMNV